MNNASIKDNFLPLVSIVIPVYNGANYLKKAIDSALAQTYKNIEVIVVNDGSNDNGKTEKVAKRYGDNIRYFYKKNGGCGSALNLAIEQMQGEYFSWLSHDDIYEKDKVECQIDALKKLNNPNVIIYSRFSVMNSCGKKVFESNPATIFSEAQLNTPLFPLLNGLIHGCSLLIPKKHFLEIGKFDENLMHTQDYDLWFKFLRGNQILFIDKPLVRSRKHAKQSTYIVPNRWAENNALWSGFLKDLTATEMIAIGGSEYEFLKGIEIFVVNAQFKETEKLARKMIKEVLERDIKISVIIPFFERVAWTIEAIQSVQNQTYKNTEIVVVNDGATQDITDLLGIVKSDGRIKYFANKENLGVAVSRNVGIEKATGEYIAFLDSDDLFAPEKLEMQLKYMKRENFIFSHTSYDYININKEKIKFIDTSSAKGNVFSNIICSFVIAAPTVMVKTAILKDERFPENLDAFEDIFLWITLAKNYSFGVIDKPLSQVRVHEEIVAFDHEKQIKRLINIDLFLINHEYFCQNKEEIARLLVSAQNILKKKSPILLEEVLQEISEDARKMKKCPRFLRHGQLILNALRFLRKYGLKMTWDRAIERLKHRNI
ncbi:MAG: glycosyltransferase [Gammaproteobacteria bacterium]|nr:glycosyltransferase [Gammaproteobacteria bacterium]